ncbi:MAG TPA: acyltransferase [Chitinophagaceae bacterium]|nr:acyltransferase [Chitinophagaceae bacterium]
MANIFDESARVSDKASIEVSSRGTNTVLGKNCVVDDFVKIKHVGGSGDIIIGDNVYLNSCTVIYSGNGVKIGSNTAIGPNTSIVPINHKFEDKTKLISEQRFADSKGGIVIEEDVWIGAGVTILDGAYIRKGAVIGAGSLVNKEIEAYSINVGSPCRKVGSRQ